MKANWKSGQGAEREEGILVFPLYLFKTEKLHLFAFSWSVCQRNDFQTQRNATKNFLDLGFFFSTEFALGILSVPHLCVVVQYSWKTVNIAVATVKTATHVNKCEVTSSRSLHRQLEDIGNPLLMDGELVFLVNWDDHERGDTERDNIALKVNKRTRPGILSHAITSSGSDKVCRTTISMLQAKKLLNLTEFKCDLKSWTVATWTVAALAHFPPQLVQSSFSPLLVQAFWDVCRCDLALFH